MTSAPLHPDAPRRRLAVLLLAAMATATTLWLSPATCQAQGGHAPGVAVAVANAHPTWEELNPVQQHALAPLAGEWNSFPELNRRKWLKIAERYEKFSPAEQARLQTRMTEWVKMTPQQRRLARENYQITRSLPAKKKTEAWDKYQQLPEEQKKNLAAAEKVPRRPGAVSALPSGRHLPTETNRQLHLQKKAPAGTTSTAMRKTEPASAAPAQEPPAPAATTGAPGAAADTPREAATEAASSSTAGMPDEPVRR
ncbi:DUF3106 domain-containing protein [Cupriavidus basilensis]|uniref:DUF3106 domain-containing protein n=1 Tax=Cupriavidus basilensis TaxID=68895 RepID=A0ABT6ANU5_9BURK|nr:DUF3106 domain-containing protein [Cupriavidus basilensis]MDF3834295.1 DUF3106 domain-containing protein [Cupriavidus basilensis]